MNQLFLNDQPTQLFFNSDITAQDLKIWLESQEYSFVSNMFGVTELFNCWYEAIDEITLIISGDNDYKELVLTSVYQFEKIMIDGKNDLIRQPSN